MAGIGFNDGSGYIVLRGVLPAPLNRFRGFTPSILPIGPTTTSVGTGRSAQWEYRREFRVAVELPFLCARSASGETSLRIAGRLVAYLMGGGAVDLIVEDDIGTASATCWMAEGTTPSLALEDPQSMFYTFSATFANSTTPFVAVYGGFRP